MKLKLNQLLIVMLIFAIAGCGNQNSQTSDQGSEEETANNETNDESNSEEEEEGTDENTNSGTTNGNTSDNAGEEVTVLIENATMFQISELRIKQGTRVTWVNKDNFNHTVYEMENLFNSGDMAQDATFSYTFDQPGTYTCYCSIHPNMEAKVIVEG